MRPILPAIRINRLTLSVLACFAAAAIPAAAGNGRFMGTALALCWFLALAAQPKLDFVWRVFAWIAVASAAGAAIQLPWLPRPPGPFSSPNDLGAFAAVALFLCLRHRFRFPAAASLMAVALSQSRGAVLAVAAGGVVWVWRGPKRFKLAAALGIIAVAAGIAILLWRPEARLNIWRIGLELAAKQPLTGWGIGGVEIWPLDHFYSVPLDWLIATGMIGAAAGLWLAVTATRLADHETRAILAAWAVAGLFLSATPIMWALLLAVLAELVGRDEAARAGVVEHDEPLLDSRV